MDFKGIESFIKEKSNGKNLEIMLVLKLLLENDSLTENSIYKTITSFLNEHSDKLPNSYSKHFGSKRQFFLNNKVTASLSKLADNQIIRSSGNNRISYTLTCSLETSQKTELLKLITIQTMFLLKISNSSELAKLGLNSLIPFIEGTNDVVPDDVNLHEDWHEGQPPTRRMLILSMLENFEKKTRQLIKVVYENNPNWIKEKIQDIKIREIVNAKVLEKQERAKRMGQEITLDKIDQFLNSTDYGTLISIIFANPRDFSKALNDKDLLEIKTWLLNIKRIRDPRSHADETFLVDDLIFNQAKFYISSALKRIEAFLESNHA